MMKVSWTGPLNHALDRAVRPYLQIGRRRAPMFQVCGCTGLALAVALAMSLVASRGLPLWVMAAIVVAAVSTFFALAFATKVVTGEEQLVYYHHEVAVMTVAALLVWSLRRPVLPYLDATILGVGLFLACGRIGCLMVGCCHGRPSGWGVRYRDVHAAAGFPACYVGVRLFPIQAVESLWVFGVVAVGSALIWFDAPPGAAFAWYVVMYDTGRFCFEFARGDSDRPYHLGFSEGQWISLVLTWVVAAAGRAGALPAQPWHVWVAGGLALMMVAVALRRRLLPAPSDWLLHPRHVNEMAECLVTACDPPDVDDGIPHNNDAPPVSRVGRTSLGVRLSAGWVPTSTGMARHYAISQESGVLSDSSALVLAGLIARLTDSRTPGTIIRGTHGVVHIVPRGAEPSPATNQAPSRDDTMATATAVAGPYPGQA